MGPMLIDMPDIPCLADNSALVIGNLNGAGHLRCHLLELFDVVPSLSHNRLCANCHGIACVALMCDSWSILTLVVLSCRLLLALFDMLPVGFE